MCVKERTARRRLAGDKWGREVDVSRDIGTVWGGGRGENVNTEGRGWTRHRDNLGNQGWMSCKQESEADVVKRLSEGRDGEANVLLTSPVFSTYQLSEAGRR